MEVGAGDGAWARALRAHGLEVAAFDREPRGPGVIAGDHLDAAAAGDVLLAIWPPDGSAARPWIAARRWRAVLICANWFRLDLGDALAGYVPAGEVALPEGRKGGANRLRAYVPATA